MRIVILAVGLAMASTTVFADEPINPAPKAKKEKVICKERVKANSRFSTRSCMTATEWKKQSETAQSAFSEIRDRQMIDITRSN